ncbi:suppressor of cytokine signaling 6-like [Lethenteron reissneri]|uniref:suppressor of cytokine signaling 6-like n=1 Tax=Lethenteron reissneri TaxID=7753 RepID=UPI002AB70080|nr:suppressor of cytokine signaling 6-like [Lethenteron reissneri]XP_061429323.1 suppressor of cytokine signaling 6-like [Lethenteron reissneri]XP_061429324.1 suppressor of cytokine signaling 6-like [Lethenteron reissneri]
MKKISRSLRKSFHLKRSREEEETGPGACHEHEGREAATGVVVRGDGGADGDEDDAKGRAKGGEGFMGTLRRRLSSRQRGRGKDGDRAAPPAAGAVAVTWAATDVPSPVTAPPTNGERPPRARWSPASSSSSLSTGSRSDPAASPLLSASPPEANGTRRGGEACRLATRAPAADVAPRPDARSEGRRCDGLNENVPTDDETAAAGVPFPESTHARMECGGGGLRLELRLPGSPTANGLDCNDNPTGPRVPGGDAGTGDFAEARKADVEDMEEEEEEEEEEERSSPSSCAMLQSESDLEDRGTLCKANDNLPPTHAPDEYHDVSADGTGAEDAVPPSEEGDSRRGTGAAVGAHAPDGPIARRHWGRNAAAGGAACLNGADCLHVDVQPDRNVNLPGGGAARPVPGGCPLAGPCIAPDRAPCDGDDGVRTRRPGAGRSPSERRAGPGAGASPLDTGAVPPGACRLYEGAGRAAATSLTEELKKLARHGWYWGPVTRQEAEEKLTALPDGAFLVRDSSDERYLLSLSFRSRGRTLHTRVEHSNGRFSFYEQPELEGHASVVQLVESSVRDSEIGAFCYSRSRFPGSATYPVRLTTPVSRFMHVRSLQYLCRFVIRQSTRIDLVRSLPLPNKMKDYLQEKHY